MSPSGPPWAETTLYCTDGNGQGGVPFGGVTFDHAGNLYGVLSSGGQGGVGAVYELTPSGGWSETTIYRFPNQPQDGKWPLGGLILDSTGNLYGSASTAGSGNAGTVFELSPSGSSWIYKVLYSFSSFGFNFNGPGDKLAMDAAGNLYGTTQYDGASLCGSVFKLTPSNGSWIYTDLHDFTCGTDGGYPAHAGVVLDASGNLYGTASGGGNLSDCNGGGCGVVWKITP